MKWNEEEIIIIETIFWVSPLKHCGHCRLRTLLRSLLDVLMNANKIYQYCFLEQKKKGKIVFMWSHKRSWYFLKYPALLVSKDHTCSNDFWVLLDLFSYKRFKGKANFLPIEEIYTPVNLCTLFICFGNPIHLCTSFI